MKVAAENLTMEWLRECSVCYIRGKQEEFITCEGCGAMLYCSESCHLKDWDGGETTTALNSHQDWCHLMKGYMDREKELTDFPFTFTQETTNRQFHDGRTVEFLKQQGVYGQGLWRRLSPLLHKMQAVKKCGYYMDAAEDEWVLPNESSILEFPPLASPPPASEALMNWQQYYDFRGIPLHSPVAAVLSYAMTLYYILTTCLKNDKPELSSRLEQGKDFVIHILGAEKEVEMKEALLECARLLPGSRLRLFLIGKQILKTVDKYEWSVENLHLTVCRSLYHECQLPSPHLSVAFNAGLPAYTTWPATLSKLKSANIPAYFTDQSEYSCACAAAAVSNLGIGSMSPVTVNPFRSPLRLVTTEQNMPWFSNAFLFKLLYRSSSVTGANTNSEEWPLKQLNPAHSLQI